jgi:predicted phosphodiesterase
VRKLLQFLFRRPVIWLAGRFSSAPRQEAVSRSLSRLLTAIEKGRNKNAGPAITIPVTAVKTVIMSDHHKGAGNRADDFVKAEPNYLAALRYYEEQQFTYIALGDVEELWENDMEAVYNRYHGHFPQEAAFMKRHDFYKIFGNHDLAWYGGGYTNKKWLKKMYGRSIPVYEGLLLRITGLGRPLRFLLTHGHQGDAQSDGNRFSKWFVANVWSKIQACLNVNVNTPAKDFLLRGRHNIMMYNWAAAQQNMVLITGHTHQPVFASLSHIEKLRQDLEKAAAQNDTAAVERLRLEIARRSGDAADSETGPMKTPCYFNTGCCCFSDGDITAIEIENGLIRLVKWTAAQPGEPVVLQEAKLKDVAAAL